MQFVCYTLSIVLSEPLRIRFVVISVVYWEVRPGLFVNREPTTPNATDGQTAADTLQETGG